MKGIFIVQYFYFPKHTTHCHFSLVKHKGNHLGLSESYGTLKLTSLFLYMFPFWNSIYGGRGAI